MTDEGWKEMLRGPIEAAIEEAVDAERLRVLAILLETQRYQENGVKFSWDVLLRSIEDGDTPDEGAVTGAEVWRHGTEPPQTPSTVSLRDTLSRAIVAAGYSPQSYTHNAMRPPVLGFYFDGQTTVAVGKAFEALSVKEKAGAAGDELVRVAIDNIGLGWMAYFRNVPW